MVCVEVFGINAIVIFRLGTACVCGGGWGGHMSELLWFKFQNA